MRTAINQEVRGPLFYRHPIRRRMLRRPEGMAGRIRNPEHDTSILVDNAPNTGTRQRCLENLRPWPKGVSGNPAGRPKDTFLSQERRKFLDRPLSAEEYNRLVTVIVKRVFKRAVSGDLRASVEICNRIEGRKRKIVTLN
jgi:Family of unknown function (DUF5681)